MDFFLYFVVGVELLDIFFVVDIFFVFGIDFWDFLKFYGFGD